MPRRSKLYRNRCENYSRDEALSLADAISTLKQMPKAKFDETVELSFRTGVDPKQSDQNIRGSVTLPKGTGKEIKVVVIAAAEAADAAEAAGADFVGMEDIVEKIKGGWADFDVLIATPAAMPQIRPLGRFLGPRGLMPNPKSGTLTDDVAEAVSQSKAGRVEFRIDRGACIHVPAGKLSFPQEDIVENCKAVFQALINAKPPAAKGVYIKSCTVSSTMSPGVRIDTREISTKAVK